MSSYAASRRSGQGVPSRPESTAGGLPLAGRRAGQPGWQIPTQRMPPSAAGSASSRTALRVLSDRDRELLRHLSEGRSTAQIARAMSVSTNTVRTRIRRVSGKLRVGGRYAVIEAARGLDLA